MTLHSETERQLERRVQVRMLQDMILGVSADYWLRRAHDFEQAMPRPGDHRGGAVDWETGAALEAGADQDAIAERLRASADDCRSRADELTAERWSDIA